VLLAVTHTPARARRYKSNYYSRALEFASNQLQNNKQIVLAAVQIHGLSLEFASIELRSDKQVVLSAVKQNGTALAFASLELKNDREVVLAAVRQTGAAVLHAQANMRGDKEIVLAAVQTPGLAFIYASESLKNDRDVVLAAVKQSAAVFGLAPKKYRSDREIVLAAVHRNGADLNLASTELRGDLWVKIAAATAKVYPRIDLVEETLVPLFGLISIEMEPVLKDRLSIDCDALKVLHDATVALGKPVLNRIKRLIQLNVVESKDLGLLEDWRRVEQKIYALDRLLSDLKRNTCAWNDAEEALHDIMDDPSNSNKRMRIDAAFENARVSLGL